MAVFFRTRLRVTLAIGLAVCVCAAVPAEIIVRNTIDGRIADAARKHLSGQVTVGIGSTPALLDAMTGSVHQATIRSQSDTICDLREVAVTAVLTGLRRTSGGASLAGSRAAVTLTAQTFTGMLGGSGTATVTPDPPAGDLSISAGPGGLLQVAEKVRLQGDTLTFSPASMSVLGRPASPSLQRTISGKLTIQRTLSGLPLSLVPRSAAVTSDGVQIRLAGGPATLTTSGTATAPRCGAAAS